jgi:hypothetical protein
LLGVDLPRPIRRIRVESLQRRRELRKPPFRMWHRIEGFHCIAVRPSVYRLAPAAEEDGFFYGGKAPMDQTANSRISITNGDATRR